MSRRWSYSRLSTVEQCGHKFYRRYKLGERGEETAALRKGSLVHDVLESLARQAQRLQYVGPLNKQKILAGYARQWAARFPDGGSLEDFADGEVMISNWIDRRVVIDYRKIVAVEQSFELPLINGDSLIGFIDIIERDDAGCLVVKDYKTSRTAFSTAERDASMQLGIYAMAARSLWPGEDVRLCFDMIRHDVDQYTSRTDDQLDTLMRYIMSLIARVDAWELLASDAGSYPPTLNSFCGWCDHREQCPAYGAALSVGNIEHATSGDLDALAVERERVSGLESVARSRKADIDKQIKDRCKATGGPVEAGGRVYELTQRRAGSSYRSGQVGAALADALGGDAIAWEAKASAVSADKLRRVLAAADLSDSDRICLQMQIEALAKDKTRTILTSKEIS